MTATSPKDVLKTLREAVLGDAFWDELLRATGSDGLPPFAVHLAVFVEPYLEFVLTGRKQIESRFSTQNRTPYNSVEPGDIILLKEASGPVVGVCLVGSAWYYRVDPHTIGRIRAEYGEQLCVEDEAFWEERAHSSFATLLRIEHAIRVKPFHYPKRDRRGWVTLLPRSRQLNLFRGQDEF